MFDPLCLMPADLRITVFGGRAFFKIHRLEDGVLSVLLLDLLSSIVKSIIGIGESEIHRKHTDDGRNDTVAIIV